MTRARTDKPAHPGRIALTIGVCLAILSVVSVGGLLWFLSHIARLSDMETQVTVFGTLYLSTHQIDNVSLLIALPGLLFLLAVVFLFIGVLQRRARMANTHRKWWQGATNKAFMKPVGTRVHVAWIAVATLFWIALIVVPVIVGVRGGWPRTLDEFRANYVYMTLGFYGALSAAVVGVLAVSLLKKATYRAQIRRRGPQARNGGGGKAFWRWFTFRWRYDLWLAAFGSVFIGTSPMALIFNDFAFFAGALLIGIALCTLGILAATQYWRAGEELGAGESYA